MRYKTFFRWLGLSFLFVMICLMNMSKAWAQERKEILIGAPISITGGISQDGLEQKWAYEQAIEDVNKAGGIFVKEFGKKLPVKFVAADDESDAGKTAEAMERLVKLDKVDLFLSTHTGALNIAACIVAEKYQKYYQATTAIPYLWLPHKFKWSTVYFYFPDKEAEVPFKIWKSLPESDRPKRPALLMEDSLDGENFGPGFRNHAKEYGYTFAVDEPWAIGAKDYSSQILKAKARNVDAILIFGSNTDCITFIRQMKEAGLSVKYMHGWKGTWSGEFWGSLGKDAQYILSDGFWSEDYPYPGAKELGERFYKKFNRYSLSIGLFYANAQILLKAIEVAGSLDSAKVRDAVLKTEFKGTVMGNVKYNEIGLALMSTTANQWWDGKQRLVYPFVKGASKLRLAPLWDKR